MFTRKLIAVICAGIVLCGCVNNLTVSNDDLQTKFHLVCEVSPDEPVTAKLFTTTDINGYNPVSFPTNAEITISEVGKDASFGLYFDDGTLEYVSPGGQVKAGVEYEIRCLSFEGLAEDVHARTKIPVKNEIDTIIVLATEKILQEGEVYYSTDLTIVFKEPAKKPAYFHLLPYTKSAIPVDDGMGNITLEELGDEMPIDVTDILDGLNGTEILRHREGFLVDFSRLTDRSLALRVINAQPLQGEEVLKNIYIHLKTVTESYYRYNVSESRLISAHNVSGGPSPISYTNFENGYGAFSAYNTTQSVFPLR